MRCVAIIAAVPLMFLSRCTVVAGCLGGLRGREGCDCFGRWEANPSAPQPWIRIQIGCTLALVTWNFYFSPSSTSLLICTLRPSPPSAEFPLPFWITPVYHYPHPYFCLLHSGPACCSYLHLQQYISSLHPQIIIIICTFHSFCIFHIFSHSQAYTGATN